MRNGHYTKSDIRELKIVEGDKRKNVARHAVALVGDYCITSMGLKEVFINQNGKQGKRYSIDNVPPLLKVVAEIVEKKGAGRGGWRLGAGRKLVLTEPEKKKTRSFRLTDAEFFRVQEFIESMRSESGK